VRTGPLCLSLALAGLGTLAVVIASRPATASSGTGVPPGAPVHEVHLDPGALADQCTRVQRVEKGDTFSEIAQRSLGTVRRAAELQTLNPRVDAKSLRVGQSLLLPPRKAAGRWVDFYASGRDGGAQPVGLGAPAALALGPVRVFAVPHARLLVLRAAARGAEPTEAALLADPEVAASEPFAAAVSGSRPPARAVTRLKVAALAGRDLKVSLVEQQLYGATGHRLAAYEDADTGGGLAVPLLLVVAGLVVFALVAVAARRMAALDPEDGSRAA
jgi:hypothetical protein